MFKAMQMSRQSLWVMSLSIMTLMSCTNDDFESSAISRGREISFGVSTQSVGSRSDAPAEATDTFRLVADDPQAQTLLCTAEMTPMSDAVSRATSVTSADRITKIGVIAHASWYAPLLMANDLYKRNADGVYQSTDVRYWIDDASATVDFYAFAPYSPSGMTFPTSKDDRRVEYTVPTESENQQDVMLAVSKGIKGNHNKAVGLPFKHLLAGVRVNFLSIPDNWTIRSVELEGVYSNGSLDFTADSPTWAPSGATTTVTSTNGDKTETLFMLLPQTGGATLKIVANDGSSDKTYTKNLGSSNWSMGNITTYSITITNYSFEIEETPFLDAHYVIFNTILKAKGIPSDKNWTVTVMTDDNADVSLQLTADINQYARQGFWTDKEMTNGSTITDVSARGSNTLMCSGTGSFPVTIFVPENIGDANREIILSITVEGKSHQESSIKLTQLCPAWTSSGFGWEQIDDNQSGVYGFDYNARHVYVYNDSHTIGIAQIIISRVQTLINQYNASGYASVVRYSPSFGEYRNYVDIDYRKLNTLNGKAASINDGILNTHELFSFGGTALSKNFENAITGMKRVVGNTDVNAYEPRRATDPDAVPVSIEGDLINESQMLVDVLKKNRYYLNTSTVGDLTTSTALIRVEDIVWYIPATGQFGESLDWYDGATMNVGDYWSSTAGQAGFAYTGGNVTASRTDRKLIRVARNR